MSARSALPRMWFSARAVSVNTPRSRIALAASANALTATRVRLPPTLRRYGIRSGAFPPGPRETPGRRTLFEAASPDSHRIPLIFEETSPADEVGGAFTHRGKPICDTRERGRA